MKDEQITNIHLMEQIALDFIVNELNSKKLVDKYNISIFSVREIISRMQLVRKRDTYRKTLLEKSLKRCATYQSKIIFKATEILKEHIEKLFQKQRTQKHNSDFGLTSSEIRDVMSILAVISRENKLETGKSTENIINKVQVEFPNGFSPITNNNEIVDAEFVSSEDEIKKEDIDEKFLNNEEENDKEEVNVEIDENIGEIL